MEEFESEEEKRIDSLYHSVAYLKEIHEDISVLEHALIERGEESKPYSPTFFLYVFFSFKVFNINLLERNCKNIPFISLLCFYLFKTYIAEICFAFTAVSVCTVTKA